MVRTGRREELEQRGIELHREVVPRQVRVRAHDGQDDVVEGTQDAIGVETRHRVDGVSQFDGELRCLVSGVACAVGIQSCVEQRDGEPHRFRVRGERVGQVGIGEAHPGLAQVLTQRTHDDDVARGEPGAEHQAVQPVALDRARPHPEEDVGHARLHVRIGERVALDRAHAERVDPAGPAIRCGNRVRPFVDHGHAEVLEQRHHVREHERAPGPVELDPGDLPVGRGNEADLEVAGNLEALQDREIGDRDVGRDVELIRRRKRVHPVSEPVEPTLFTPGLDQCVAKIVDPVPHQASEFGLQRGHVDIGRTVRGAHHDVQPRHHRLGDQCRVVDVGTTERALERVDDLHAHLRGVPIAG